jgi:hypothetical protein
MWKQGEFGTEHCTILSNNKAGQLKWPEENNEKV